MASLKTLAIFVVVTFLPVILAEAPNKAEDDLTPLSGPFDPYEEKIAAYLKEQLQPYDNLYIPALPVISVNASNQASISLGLGEVTFTGLTNLDVQIKAKIIPHIEGDVIVTFDKILLDVGHYSSGGFVINLPFAGEGPMFIAIHKLAATVAFQMSQDENSTIPVDIKGVNLDLRRLEVDFSNMDPGSDGGQLINIVLSSFGPDIFDYLTILLNGKFSGVFNEIAVDVLNSAYCPECDSSNPLGDKEIMNQYFSDILQDYLDVLTVSDVKINGI